MIDETGIPLPPEPIEPDMPEPAPMFDPTGAAHRPPAVSEILRGVPWVPLDGNAAETAEAGRVHDAARTVHCGGEQRDAAGRRVFRRLRDEFDPQGRHVACDHCRAEARFPCEHPLRGAVIIGFVHPSRLAAEARAFGIDPPFAV